MEVRKYILTSGILVFHIVFNRNFVCDGTVFPPNIPSFSSSPTGPSPSPTSPPLSATGPSLSTTSQPLSATGPSPTTKEVTTNRTSSSTEKNGSGFVLGDTNVSNVSLDRLKELQTNLLEGYDATIRPRLKQSKTVKVNTTFSLTSVVNFDTTGQRIDVMGYFIVTWIDDVIQWNADDYNETSRIKLPLSRIWYPPLVIGKTYDGSKVIGNVDIDRVLVSSTGVVQWVPDGVFSFMCEVSVKHYPFDVQTCELIYYVSDETISSVHLTGQENVQLDGYIENSEWHLVDASSTTKEIYNTNFVQLAFNLKRRTGFTVYTMVIPLVTLALLNIFTFLIPIESGEKGGLAITLFLAYGFFITITRDGLPHNSVQVSYYIVYITILLALSVFTVIYVIIESKIYSALGIKPFHLCGWFQSKKASDKKGTPEVDNESLPVKECMDDNTILMTWADMLGRVDIIASVSCSIFVVLLSFVMWKLVTTGS